MKTGKLFALLIFLIMVAGALGALGWHAVKADLKRMTPASVKDTDADLVLRTTELIEYKSGVMQYRLNAEQANFAKDEESGRLEKIKAIYYENGEPMIKMNAGRGDLDLSTGDAVVTDEPTALTRDGHRITSEEITYLAKQRIILSEKEVKIDGPYLQLSGSGMRFYPDHQTFTVDSGVRSKIIGVGMADSSRLPY